MWSQLEQPSLIMPQLYLGGEMPARQKETLKRLHITHILPVGYDLPRLFPQDFIYYPKKIDVMDQDYEDLIEHFDECYQWIENARNKNGTVYVHCAAGVSRSATIVTAYVMKKFRLTVDNALDYVRKGRSIIFPNFGFRQQLQIYYRCSFVFNKNDPEYVEFKKKSVEMKGKHEQVLQLIVQMRERMGLESKISEEDEDEVEKAEDGTNSQRSESMTIELKPLSPNVIELQCPLRTGKPITVIEKNTDAFDDVDNTTKRKTVCSSL
jgi:hypothetical protein